MVTYNKFDSISIGGPSINSISFPNRTTGSLNVAGNTYLGGDNCFSSIISSNSRITLVKSIVTNLSSNISQITSLNRLTTDESNISILKNNNTTIIFINS